MLRFPCHPCKSADEIICLSCAFAFGRIFLVLPYTRSGFLLSLLSLSMPTLAKHCWYRDSRLICCLMGGCCGSRLLQNKKVAVTGGCQYLTHYKAACGYFLRPTVLYFCATLRRWRTEKCRATSPRATDCDLLARKRIGRAPSQHLPAKHRCLALCCCSRTHQHRVGRSLGGRPSINPENF